MKDGEPGHRTHSWDIAEAEFESRDSPTPIITHTYTMGSWDREWSLGETIHPKLKESPFSDNDPRSCDHRHSVMTVVSGIS